MCVCVCVCVCVTKGHLVFSLSTQAVMKEVLATQIVDLAEHMSAYYIDITLVTFNWFLTLFIDAVPTEVRGTSLLEWSFFFFFFFELKLRLSHRGFLYVMIFDCILTCSIYTCPHTNRVCACV